MKSKSRKTTALVLSFVLAFTAISVELFHQNCLPQNRTKAIANSSPEEGVELIPSSLCGACVLASTQLFTSVIADASAPALKPSNIIHTARSFSSLETFSSFSNRAPPAILS